MIKEKLKKGIVDKRGIEYPNILEYHFDKGEILILGKLKAESHADDLDEYGVGNGVFVFQDVDIPTIGYRIERDYNSFMCNNTRSLGFIESLQKKQANVYLTEFTKGVVTLDNRVIGDIVPFYSDADTLRKYIKENGWEQYSLYFEAANILNELIANGIYYYDLNPDNFVITNNGLKLIDFDVDLITFDKPYSGKQERVLDNFKVMLNILSNKEFQNTYPEIKDIDSFDALASFLENVRNKKR